MQVMIRREAVYLETYIVEVPDDMDEDEAFDHAWEVYDWEDPVKSEFSYNNDWSETKFI